MDNIKEVLDGIEKKLETKAANDAKQAAESALAEVKTQLKTAEEKAVTAEKEVTEIKAWKVTKEEADKKNQEFLDKIAEERKSKPFGNSKSESKSFNDMLDETITRNAETIKNFEKGGSYRFDMMPELKKEGSQNREVKAVGDMSFSNNFPGGTVLSADYRTNLIQSPYNRVWLADILTPGTSTGNSVVYPKENGGEGTPTVWNDPTINKAQFDYDFTSQTAYFKWIAGYVIVSREMLDDVPWLSSYLQSKMLISLKTAENAFILNGETGTNPVTGLLAAATQYDNVNSYTNQVQIIVDAGWGQIVEDTNDFYQPTHAILNPRTAVAIGLNQASGSGEFDLPNGSVAFANGRLQIAGMDTVTTTSLDAGEFVVLDRAAASFIRRMQPELRMFEDSILAKANKIMFRIEERATLAIFNNAAIVKGTTAGAGSF